MAADEDSFEGLIEGMGNSIGNLGKGLASQPQIPATPTSQSQVPLTIEEFERQEKEKGFVTESISDPLPAQAFPEDATPAFLGGGHSVPELPQMIASNPAQAPFQQEIPTAPTFSEPIPHPDTVFRGDNARSGTHESFEPPQQLAEYQSGPKVEMESGHLFGNVQPQQVNAEVPLSEGVIPRTPLSDAGETTETLLPLGDVPAISQSLEEALVVSQAPVIPSVGDTHETLQAYIKKTGTQPLILSHLFDYRFSFEENPAAPILDQQGNLNPERYHRLTLHLTGLKLDYAFGRDTTTSLPFSATIPFSLSKPTAPILEEKKEEYKKKLETILSEEHIMEDPNAIVEHINQTLGPVEELKSTLNYFLQNNPVSPESMQAVLGYLHRIDDIQQYLSGVQMHKTVSLSSFAEELKPVKELFDKIYENTILGGLTYQPQQTHVEEKTLSSGQKRYDVFIDVDISHFASALIQSKDAYIKRADNKIIKTGWKYNYLQTVDELLAAKLREIFDKIATDLYETNLERFTEGFSIIQRSNTVKNIPVLGLLVHSFINKSSEEDKRNLWGKLIGVSYKNDKLVEADKNKASLFVDKDKFKQYEQILKNDYLAEQTVNLFYDRNPNFSKLFEGEKENLKQNLLHHKTLLEGRLHYFMAKQGCISSFSHHPPKEIPSFGNGHHKLYVKPVVKNGKSPFLSGNDYLLPAS